MFFFTKCINNGKSKTDIIATSDYTAYAGSASCINCHKSIYDAHINTAHFLTSAVADEKNIRGSFDSSKNTFVYNNGALVAMEKQVNGFYQVAYINNVEKKSQRIDIVIGSGTKGQSFASWSNNHLFQLPITYFTSEDQWSNSPGYPNKIAFNRPITSRCLECHATFASTISAPEKETEEFNRNQIILGVDCERCHGPAANMQNFKLKTPMKKKQNLSVTWLHLPGSKV
jgi:Cytochrome c554 and c-prime